MHLIARQIRTSLLLFFLAILMPIAHGNDVNFEPWYVIGPFKDTDFGVVADSLAFPFEPEQHALNDGGIASLGKIYHAKKLPGVVDTERRWQRHEDWTDANVPYYSTYANNIQNNCRLSVLYGPDERINISHPAHSAFLLAPLAKDAGGWGICREKNGSAVFADKNDPDYQVFLRNFEQSKENL